MGRAPCCEKTGVKRGPWTIEEDQILISYIQQHGHANWRALPKEAGLLRCGKSCRLRWINYLRPDIKRGNFSNEEEEAIIKLHELLGNRWSSIAAKLPGRTDNEIKNVWHTHLKKRLKNNSTAGPKFHSDALRSSELVKSQNLTTPPASQPPSSGDLSSATDSSAAGSIYTNNEASTIKREETGSPEYFPEIDESFWSEDLSNETSSDYFQGGDGGYTFQFPSSPAVNSTSMEGVDLLGPQIDHNGMDFWYDLFLRAGELPECIEF